MSRKFQIENVNTFRGYAVLKGEVYISDSEYADILDDIYGDVQVGGMTYGTGSVLQGVDPVAFDCGKNDYASELQSELEAQLDNEDEEAIEFVDDCDDEEEEDEE